MPNTRQILPFVLALVVVPVTLLIAEKNFKTAVLSIIFFWICLAVFFYPNLKDCINAYRDRR